MPRALSSGMLAAIQATSLSPAIFVEMHFADGVQRVWSGIGTILFNSVNWLGVGSFGGVSIIEEGTGVEAKGITLSLSGIDQSMLAEALQNLQLGLPVTVYLGMFDGSGNLISTPTIAWAGRIDQSTIEVGAESATISINCENRLLDMNVPVDRRYTHDDQQIDFPGDLGFFFVASIQEQTIYWGRTPSSSNNV